MLEINAVLSEIFSDEFKIFTGISIIMTDKISIARKIIEDIVRNDRKFFAPALKNSGTEKATIYFLWPLNNPPARKVFIIKPIRRLNKKPSVKEANIKFRFDPRSAKTSGSKPSASFSVIVLLPNADIMDPLTGIARITARIRVKNHTIIIPFQELADR